jgi:hypothetical protein
VGADHGAVHVVCVPVELPRHAGVALQRLEHPCPHPRRRPSPEPAPSGRPRPEALG